LNRHVIAKDPDVFANVCNLKPGSEVAQFFMVEKQEVDPNSKFTDEKLSLVLMVYRAENMDDVVRILNGRLDVGDKGHSVGIHTNTPQPAVSLAEEIDVLHVVVNQAHTLADGSSFGNGPNFTFSMGGGTWAGNPISDNLNYTHFINIAPLVTTILEDKPSEDALFGSYFKNTASKKIKLRPHES